MFKIELGTIVKDKVTGFIGVVMARTEYATGCKQYGTSKQTLNKDGGIDDWLWFDEVRLEPTTKKPLKLTVSIGGPQQTPPSF